MNKRRIASYICFFLAFVLLVLAAAAPIYREGVPDYDEKYDVIEGSGGFLFRARGASSDELGDFSGKNLYTEDALSRTVTALTSIAGKLRDGGCGVLFVFVPSKMTVYRDRLPGNVARLYSAERKYTELLSALEGAGERTLDLTETFSRIKDGEQIYHTASDDLNDLGGFRLAEASLSALGLGAPKETDYDISESSDTDYPLCREYRNETGKTVPNRTLTLTEKEPAYEEDAECAFEDTYATVSAGGEGTLLVAYTDGASACRKFFSPSAKRAVFREGIAADDAVTEKYAPDNAVFVICENALGRLPRDTAPVPTEEGVSSTPAVTDVVHSDSDCVVIFGTAEANSAITVRGGEETVTVRTTNGLFAAEVRVPVDGTAGLSVTAKTDGKAQSDPVAVSAEYDPGTGYKNVVVGKDGHLHYQETVPDFTGETAYPPETLAGYVGYIRSIADRIHSVSPDTKVIFLVAPNHLTIYPETAPDDLYAMRSDVTRLGQFTEAFRDDDKIIFPDLTRELTEALKTAPFRLYNKTDTHWNELGAYYAYAAVMRLISRDFPSAAPDPLSDFNVFTKLVPGGDMANFLGADLNAVNEEGVFVRSKNGLASGINKDYSMNFENAWFSDQHEFTVDDPSLPTMIMYRDSFSTNLMSFMAEKFRKSVFHTMWEYPEELELYREMQPDYVIIERVERNLGGI